jgi:predicted pyridoxine 5'-phosphate oxidase superfamily flavin-nucleotide-binding protein
MPVSTTSSPFHQGEREIQERLGVREQLEEIGTRFIRGYMPGEHRAFYAQLPFLLIGSVDNRGRPWASVLVGRPGFISSTTPNRLKINTRLIDGDPLKDGLSSGKQVGLLGIEYESRRRNRMNGKIAAIDDGAFEIEIDQAFGNCPQYIQSRALELLPGIDTIGETRPTKAMVQLDARASQIISRADNFYIATHYSDGSGDSSHGTDVSHRGGKPGFVLIENDRTITFPDYSGNNHFNTIGNLMMNPLAGLLFIDFESGDLLYLTCKAEVIWDSEELHAFDGAERLVRFTVDEGMLVKNAKAKSLHHSTCNRLIMVIFTAIKPGNFFLSKSSPLVLMNR